MTERLYRETLENWCDEIEVFWKSTQEQLTNQKDLPDVQRWEEKFSLFKQELVNSELGEEELSSHANRLHEDLNQLLTHIEVRQEEEGIQPVAIGEHRLPPLPYPYHALEPVIAAEIMRLHHKKHHQSYVDGLNKAELEMKKARDHGDFSLIKHWEREAAFHGSGHYLHTIFWSIMSPEGGGKPSGPLATAIDQSFGGFDQFKRHFSEAAKNVEAVGWAILVWAPRSGRLEILTAEKHQNLTQWDTIPLLVLDVWEHAYYLQYKNERAKYVDHWWKIVNWKEVENRFHKAKKLTWQPY